ncbi:MAG: TlpA disulfide reductase family protein [Mucilaginibacter sp.]
MCKPALFFITFFLFSEYLYGQTVTTPLKMDTLTVRLLQIPGIGPAGFSSIGLSATDRATDDEQVRSYPELKNIPAAISDVKAFFHPVNLLQYLFENYFIGKISKSYLMEKAKFYRWNLADTTRFSNKALKLGIAFITGFDENKKEVCMIDENNNGDLADDTIRPLTKQIMDPDQIVNTSRTVAISYFWGGKLYEKKILVAINQPFNTQHGQVSLTFPEFAYAKFLYKGQSYLITKSSDYMSDSFVAVLPDKPNFSPVNASNRTRVNRFFKIGNDDFKLISINEFTNEVVIAKEDVKDLIITNAENLHTRINPVSNTDRDNTISASVGFIAPLVKGTEINIIQNAKPIVSTQNLKGKYVFIDFWATYCAPCIDDLPKLADVYKKFSRDKFEMIGVLDENNYSIATKLLHDNNVSWPTIQLHDAKTNIEGYAPIVSFPSSYLIDPKGKIIAVNLRGDELMSTLMRLLNVK